jgi:Tol biopolymer transport system component
VAPDETYMVFSSARKKEANDADLYISFNEKGAWTDPIILGDLVNTKANEYSPFLSPDGNYLFFVRHDGKNGDIYWVHSRILYNFKSK